MKKKTVISGKKRGPRASGKGEPVVVRMHPPQLRSLDDWIAKQRQPFPSRPEAIRRLVEIGLSKTPAAKPQVSTNRQSAARAAELAAKVIEKKLPPDTPAEEKAVRKRKLIQGPSVFRDTRKDHPR